MAIKIQEEGENQRGLVTNFILNRLVGKLGIMVDSKNLAETDLTQINSSISKLITQNKELREEISKMKTQMNNKKKYQNNNNENAT